MKNNGKGLEKFVSEIETAFTKEGFEIIQNRRVYSEDGIQLAELDLEILGAINGKMTHTLIECRDRPSQGKAPASWIQQMAGRRLQFSFDKVIAVSTTGFSEAALSAARTMDVELRELTVSSTPPSIRWLETPASGSALHYSCNLIQGYVSLREPGFGEHHSHLQTTLREGIKNNSNFMRTRLDGLISIGTAWDVIWYYEHTQICELIGDRKYRKLTIYREPTDDGSLWVETTKVCAPVKSLSFLIELTAETGGGFRVLTNNF